MEKKLKILHLEDTESDADILSRQLRKAGLDCEIKVVDGKNEFRKALTDFQPDIILSDHSLPSFNSIDALQMVKELSLKIPFILVTGTLSGDVAAEIMKQGADDYLIKDRLERLPSAIRQTLLKYRAEKERENAVKEIQKSQANLEAIIENTEAGIYSIDREFRLLTINSRLKDELKKNYGVDAQPGDNVLILMGNVMSPLVSALREIYVGVFEGNPVRFVRELDSDGAKRYLNFSLNPIKNNERVIGLSCFITDITKEKLVELEIKELNESLERKVEERTGELQRANNELEAFNFMVSHDLRNPLQIISGYASLIIRKYERKLPEEAHDLLQRIKMGTKNMGQIIEELLNFSRLGRASMTLELVDFDSLIHSVVNELKVSIPDFRAEVIIHPINLVQCDEAMTRHIWVNLISNAIKYSAKREKPVVEIGYKEMAGKTVYYIRDNGIGFDMTDQENLFTLFKRLDNADGYEGIGAGLALVQNIITKHGGRIWAESKPDMGATFYFTLQERAA